jgi:hypothetical protein
MGHKDSKLFDLGELDYEIAPGGSEEPVLHLPAVVAVVIMATLTAPAE